MKRLCLLFVTFTLSIPSLTAAQDAATEEKLNQLNGKIEDIIAAQDSQRKRLAELAKEIDHLREQMGKPSGNYASQDDMKRLAETIKEVDRHRLDDNEKIRAEILKLGKVLSAPPPKSKPVPVPGGSDTSTDKSAPQPDKSDKGVFEYTIQSGDTLDAIVQAYKAKNIKITVAQIKQANPGLVPEKMKVGQKIVIPAP